MKIIAVASDGESVSPHFGHCEGFTLFQTENGQITGKTYIPNPGHKPGFLPVFLAEKNVSVIISGGMGGGAVDLFNEKNIAVVTGAAGAAADAVTAYLAGKLVSSGSVCHDHSYEGECGK
ncbi:MAG: NifB/NifX family molybdenum-iron cluster-binding protein [Treponema sp.]|nr:NifB/NifX family molybdenum-iron cluster-binding protein [Treponema sp.]